MSPEAEATPAATPEAAPDALTDLRAGLAERIGKSEQPAPESASPDADGADQDAEADGASAAPADGEPSAPDADGDEAQDAPEEPADPFAGMSRKQRGAAIRAAEENLKREREAREAAEKRAADLEAISRAGDEVFVSLTGTDDQLAELKRKARGGDIAARDQADIYEANRELLAPVKAALRKQADQEAMGMAWAAIGEHFKAGAKHLPAADQEGFLKAENVQVGLDYFAEKLTTPLKSQIKSLKDENKALKAEVEGFRARDAHRGAAPVAGGRSASTMTDPNASSLDQIRAGLAARLKQPA